MFYKEFEDARKARQQKAGREVAFRFHDVVLFFAVAAAQGIIGNFAYYAIAKAIRAIRQPKREIGGAGIRFEAVVSRQTYDRVRRKKHTGKKARQTSNVELEKTLKKKYGTMVSLQTKQRKQK